MKIGLNGGSSTVARMVDQAVQTEEEGFSSLWYPSAVAGDPLVAMALAGRATTTLELGTAVLQTYTSHPALMANRVLAVASAMGRNGFTLGLGPSHEVVIEGSFGISYANVGRHTEEYVTILTQLLHGEAVEFRGDDFEVRLGTPATAAGVVVPVLVAALARRLLRVAGAVADGTILWMANARAVATHVAPLIRDAAETAGRDAPRIVAGLPVAVHDNVDEAREAAAKQFGFYGGLPNYRRILDLGGAEEPADAAIVGDEAAVAAQIEAMFEAGATDMWASVFPVGDDREGSRTRTRKLLQELARS
jgi:F420-dependent oxidoreductase-like protein